ncbi:four helix bundle protein [Sphingobacterium hungaricum]|uniref:Four helix bundle protein n=1 Tax=Sphingobacterium hungaricum TaxID=2082723 RepID=A0A928YQA4_9SPHI|nr:four helix bundle protein [Sphingobacterium hungaricum]MBE8713744.1 four helix bundle protein [Sphingobacterium hungaricum]
MENNMKPVDIKHRAYRFSKDVILFVKDQTYDRVYLSLIDQVVRSSTSIGANLVEGYAGSSKRDFIKYYLIALKSANESKYWICLLRDTIWKENHELKKLLSEADELSKIIASIIIKTKENMK